jgi:hypothetical protein
MTQFSGTKGLSHLFKAADAELSIRMILSLNTLIQSIALLLMFRPQVKAYFKV